MVMTVLQTMLFLMIPVIVAGGLLPSSPSLFTVVSAEEQQPWKTYTDKRLGMSYQYPSTWTKSPTDENTTQEISNGNILLDFRYFASTIDAVDLLYPRSYALLVLADYEKTKTGPISEMHLIDPVTKLPYSIGGEEAYTFTYGSADAGYIQVIMVVHGNTVIGFQYSTAFWIDIRDPQELQTRDGILKSIKFIAE